MNEKLWKTKDEWKKTKRILALNNLGPRPDNRRKLRELKTFGMFILKMNITLMDNCKFKD